VITLRFKDIFDLGKGDCKAENSHLSNKW